MGLLRIFLMPLRYHRQLSDEINLHLTRQKLQVILKRLIKFLEMYPDAEQKNDAIKIRNEIAFKECQEN